MLVTLWPPTLPRLLCKDSLHCCFFSLHAHPFRNGLRPAVSMYRFYVNYEQMRGSITQRLNVIYVWTSPSQTNMILNFILMRTLGWDMKKPCQHFYSKKEQWELWWWGEAQGEHGYAVVTAEWSHSPEQTLVVNTWKGAFVWYMVSCHYFHNLIS